MQLNPTITLQSGKYKIIRTLGQGGFGITYEAEQVALHRRVAIKEFFMKEYCDRNSTTSHVTLGTSEGNKELVERFKTKFIREAQLIAGFDNPHIIKIYDIFEENGTAYYVMPFLAGGSLTQKVTQNGPMQQKEAIGYITQIGNALDYLHKQNILHLDVKPSNVLLNAIGEAVLIDFGISKHYDDTGSQTSTTPIGISKGYAPMEQYQQGNLTSFSPATDIYSLGATFFYLLTGEAPPEASEVNEDGLPDIMTDISSSVKMAIEKSMSPRRKDRPQTINSFLSLLAESPKLDDNPASGRESKADESTRVVLTSDSSVYVEEPSPNKTENTIIKSIKTEVQEPTPIDNASTTNEPKKHSWIPISLTALVFCFIGYLMIGNPFARDHEGSTTSDEIYIDGAFARRIPFEAPGGNCTFSIETTFKEDWEHDPLPDWCSINSGRTAFTIICHPNSSLQPRQATIHFYKKDSPKELATIIIYQSGMEEAKASSISMQKTGLIEARAGEHYVIDYTIQPIEASNHKVSWTSSNTSVATVSSNGTITVKSSGKTTITAKVDGVSASCLVEVRIKTNTQNSTSSTKQSQTTNNTSNTTSSSSSTSARSLNHSYEAIYTGRTVQLSVNGYRGSVTWKSDAPSIASVSSNGLVTGRKAGQTIIWAHFKEGEPLRCYISVVENSQ